MNPQALEVEILIIIDEGSPMSLTSFFFLLLLFGTSILRADKPEIKNEQIEVHHKTYDSNQSIMTHTVKKIPTFEQWVANGKKLPDGIILTGGNPWFNESNEQKRTVRDVYDLLYPKKKTAPSKPNRTKIKPVKRKLFPKHWGDPPKNQTRDLRTLPGGYGMGSGTLANWIQGNLERDKNISSHPD